jgi:hypothetical protein
VRRSQELRLRGGFRASIWHLCGPPPDLNPTERAWAKIKKCLRSTRARTKEDLDQAITETLALIAPDYAQAWVRHSIQTSLKLRECSRPLELGPKLSYIEYRTESVVYRKTRVTGLDRFKEAFLGPGPRGNLLAETARTWQPQPRRAADCLHYRSRTHTVQQGNPPQRQQCAWFRVVRPEPIIESTEDQETREHV